MIEVTNPHAHGMCGDRLERIGEHLKTRFLDVKKIPGCQVLVARRGEALYYYLGGLRDIERKSPMTEDTIFRIYSMTKPITSVALMTLFERGRFLLEDPVHRYIPEWSNLKVRLAGSYPDFQTIPCARSMTMRDLLCHTSGLTYDFLNTTNLDAAYRELGVARPRPGYTLKDMVDQLSFLPLEFSPGTRWNYSIATDVLGYLIEVISGQSFPVYLRENIFEPLGMVDTSFNLRDDQCERFASCYERDTNKKLLLQDDSQDSEYKNRTYYSGGGGLLSTLPDYWAFCKMLEAGGVYNGNRIISSRTLAYMTRNHLPDGKDLSIHATGSFSETAYRGVGFGLGFACKVDPVLNGNLASFGTYYWGGLASTLFWIDPVEKLTVIFMTQLIPSSTFNFRGQLESIIYGALD